MINNFFQSDTCLGKHSGFVPYPTCMLWAYTLVGTAGLDFSTPLPQSSCLSTQDLFGLTCIFYAFQTLTYCKSGSGSHAWVKYLAQFDMTFGCFSTESRPRSSSPASPRQTQAIHKSRISWSSLSYSRFLISIFNAELTYFLVRGSFSLNPLESTCNWWSTWKTLVAR